MAVAAILAPSGCSLGADKEPQPVSGVPKDIATMVDQLERSIAEKKFAEVCDELFTAGAKQRAGGADCASQLSSAAEGVRHPTIEIRGIDVQGSRATVRVATEADGQARAMDTLRLRREGGHWRVDALTG
jgi:hypothetical protein